MRQNNENNNNAAEAFATIGEKLDSLPAIDLQGLASAEKPVLICIDMVNGFAKKGALYSPYVEALLPKIAALATCCNAKGIPCLAFLDEHPQDSPEFASYPQHCLENSWESKLAEELDGAAAFIKFPKHSTNGVLSSPFTAYLKENPEKGTFIVTGCCTDICVLQFALTLKAWFHERNLPVRVIVPRELVDTFDAKEHNRILMNELSLYLLLESGIEVVRQIKTGGAL